MIRATGQCLGLEAKVRTPARMTTAGHQVLKISHASTVPALSSRRMTPTATTSRPKKRRPQFIEPTYHLPPQSPAMKNLHSPVSVIPIRQRA